MDKSGDSGLNAKPGDVLVNALETFNSIEELKQEFDPLFFLDLTLSLETAVLHNTIFAVNSMPHSDNPIGKALIDEGILLLFKSKCIDSDEILNHPRSKLIMSALPSSLRSAHIKEDMRMIAAASSMHIELAFEDWYDIPVAWSAHHTPLYLLLPELEREQNASMHLHQRLSDTYTDYRDTLLSIRNKYDGPDFFRIPPIALEILNKSKNLEEVPSVLLEVRDKYKGIREHFTELDEIMRSQDVSPFKKHQENLKIQRSIDTLFSNDEKTSINVRVSFAKSLNDVTKVNGAVEDGMDASDVNWTKAIGHIIEAGKDTYWKFRLRPLHATKQGYLGTSIKKMQGAIEKHFSYSLKPEDENINKNYFDGVEKLRNNLSINENT